MEARWYALQVRSRCENSCEVLLKNKGYEVFLPRFTAKISRRGSQAAMRQPLFSGYLFCRVTQNSVGKMVVTPGVVRVLGFGNKPEPVADHEIESLGRIDQSEVNRRPWQYLPGGSLVEIQSGPLAGVQGTLISEGSARRIVVSVTLLHRSVCAELDEGAVLIPIGMRGGRSWQPETTDFNAAIAASRRSRDAGSPAGTGRERTPARVVVVAS